MTDPDLVAKKLALIETCVRELRTLGSPAAIPTDTVQVRDVVEHRLDDLLAFARIIRRRVTGDG